MKSLTLVLFANQAALVHTPYTRLGHVSPAVLIVAVTCRPDKPDLKQLKAEAARKKACLHDCTSVKFDPVCAGKQGEKPKSFGSECVMNNYNCEHKDTLQKVSKEQCAGSDGIRLS